MATHPSLLVTTPNHASDHFQPPPTLPTNPADQPCRPTNIPADTTYTTARRPRQKLGTRERGRRRVPSGSELWHRGYRWRGRRVRANAARSPPGRAHHDDVSHHGVSLLKVGGPGLFDCSCSLRAGGGAGIECFFGNTKLVSTVFSLFCRRSARAKRKPPAMNAREVNVRL